MWWLASIILLVPGVALFGWMSDAMGKPWYSRPLILHRTVPVTIILVVSVGLMLAGLYSLWQANSVVFLVVVGLVVLVMAGGAMKGRAKSRATRFFKAYQQLQIYRPEATQKELVEEAIRFYLKGTRQEGDADSIIRLVCEDGKDLTDLKKIAHMVFTLEDPNGVDIANFERHMKKSEKRMKSVIKAHDQVFAIAPSQSLKPVLSTDMVKRMKEQGMDPDQMSNEQLAALSTLQDPQKSHWFAQIFLYGGYGCGLLALIRLFALDIPSVVIYVVLGLVLSFIGYKIQSRVASKKFYQASIRKWAEEQRKASQK